LNEIRGKLAARKQAKTTITATVAPIGWDSSSWCARLWREARSSTPVGWSTPF